MPSITYTPRGRGCEVRLLTESAGELHIAAAGIDDEAPTVEGSPELLGNMALVTSLLTYAANELAFRKSRSPEKRNSHRTAKVSAEKDALAITKLIAGLGDDRVVGWCSGCLARAAHVHVRGHDRPRRKYLCGECGTPTTACAVPRCSHLAVVQPTARLTLCYCAEHHHGIPGFEKLGDRLTRLDGYETWLQFESRNAKRVTYVAGGTLAAAAVIAPLALLAAPAVGAALGGSALGGSLTGAAATSHGLAMLGGGSIAAGGLGMAGGTAVVTATGSALGGVLGAVTTSAYVSSDSSFRIEKLRDGRDPAVIIASGFLTDRDDGWGRWRGLIDRRYPDATVYRLHWGAKELASLGVFVASGAGKVAARKTVAKLARKGSKSFGGLPGIGTVFAVRDIASNPWSIAKNRAGMTGAVLADLIARTDEASFVLVGHSLGARVMVTAAQALATKPGATRIEAMHLLGAAVGVKGDWRTVNDAVQSDVWNYHSTNDAVLRYLYTVGQLGEQAVGLAGLKTTYPRIKNRNATRSVAGHSGYFSGAFKLAE